MLIESGKRVLVFSAHAADFCSRAGGTIARFVEAGSQVEVRDMSYGEKCESPAIWAGQNGVTHAEVKAIREREIEAAAGILGAGICCFDFGDSPLVVGPERRHQVLEAVRAFRPHLVLTHWLDDFLHPDHVEAAQAALWACRYCNAPGIDTEYPPCARPTVMCFECVLGSAPACEFTPDLYVDVSAVFERKLEALRQLAAQPQLPRGYEILARYRALEASTVAGMTGIEYAEGFCRIVAQTVA